MKRDISYKSSGVDLHKADAFIRAIKPLAQQSSRPGVLRGVGGFGAFFRLPLQRYKNPVLVSSADGVGTKLKVGILAQRFEGLGVDLVAMNVNDILTCGAEPLFFLDYLAVGRLQPVFMKEVVRGVAHGCKEAGCALVGGETAELPGLYRNHDFDLAGFAVGIVEENAIIDGSRVRSGDTLIGCASTGFHSNGFSLVRRVLPKPFIRKHAAEILKPTRIYVKPVLRIIRRVPVLAMAHITGGSFYEKLPRVFPKGLGAVVDAGSWRIPRVFKWVREKAGVSTKEMYRVFNMGIGFVLIVRSGEKLKVLSLLENEGVEAWVIGKVVKGKGVRVQ